MTRLAALFLCAVFVGSSPLYGQQAAIRANGIIESSQTGFRFPDGSIQSTAATVTGGVPSVNGIPGAVTIAGSGGNTVSTASGTITVAGPYKRTIIVSPVANNPAASGTALLNALASITTNSATNRYLLKIEPGTYDIGANQLVMKSYVDIEGSGQSVTRIEAARGTGEVEPNYAGAAAIRGASVSELRQVTVVNTSSNVYGFGYAANGAADVRLSDVTLHATGALIVQMGLFLENSSVDASRLTIVAKATLEGSGGIYIAGASAAIRLSQSTMEIHAGEGTSGTGFTLAQGATAMIDSCTILVEGGTSHATGVMVNDASATMTNSTVRVSGAPDRKGVATISNAASMIDIHDSRIIVGNVWNSLDVRALSKGTGSQLRAYSTLTDSASYGAPVCVLTYSYSGTTSCPPPS